ncbi:MFS transporter [Mammaliicoccus sciuri]|uniref:MFS transporter n=1 Tax=Mammaliicoccus sciuri TaxID=1296 RepID=UPI001E5AE43E|nr:MFS transporter [Mammaliicoccus sciuri]
MRQVSSEETFNTKLYPPMILGSILNPINSSMLAVALIPIAQAFDIPFYQTTWLVSSLYLATSIGQPVIGKLIDIFGPRGLFLFATSLVGIASLIAIFTPSFYGLVLARFLIGIGTCAGYPSAMYLISYEGKRTGKDSPSKILTMLSISNQTISVIGPTIGGLLIHSGGWQAIFLVNVPLSILSFVFGFLYYPKVESPKKLNALKEQIDFIGIALFTITLTTWMIFFMEPDPSIFYLFIIGLFSLIAFVIMELKSKKTIH